MKIRVEYKDVETLLDSMGSHFYLIKEHGKEDLRRFFFLPYWFELDEGDLFAHRLGDLPEELERVIKETEEDRLHEDSIKKYPLAEDECYNK